MTQLSIALSKGRIADQVMAILKKQYAITMNSKRQLTYYIEKENILIYLMKSADICTYVEQGHIDIGILGNDIIDESQHQLYEIGQLDLGKCKLCIAGPDNTSWKQKKRLNIASKYPNLAKAYLDDNHLEGSVYKLNGSVELGPLLGLSDVILDIVETGQTLKDNGLVVLEDVLDVSSKIVANKISYKLKKDAISSTVKTLQGEILEASNETSTEKVVSKILKNIQQDGEKALLSYVKKLDGFDSNHNTLLVTPREIEFAKKQVGKNFINILIEASQNIFNFHNLQKTESYELTVGPCKLGQRIVPMDRIGVYVPGGTASYPSSVLMNIIPAQIAKVPSIAVATPPNKDGTINPYVLVALDYLGIKEIYKMGGAQAIGAFAYGTEKIIPVNKIVGPGNKYVAEAKKQVFGKVAIDMIAGPSEILIIADNNASPKLIASDLLGQLEHDTDAKGFLVTTDETLIEKTKIEVQKQILNLSRFSILKESINHIQYSLVKTIEDAIDLSNDIAPEHLEIMVNSPYTYLDQITSAGSIFIGDYSPEALGDYFGGVNHTLPTNGTAKFSSPLGVYDFIKRPSYIYYDKDALKNVKDKIITFATIEGLDGHGQSVNARFDSSL